MLTGRSFLRKYFDCFCEGELNMDFLPWLFLLLLHAWQGFCHSSYTSYVSINFQHPCNLICAGEALSHSQSRTPRIPYVCRSAHGSALLLHTASFLHWTGSPVLLNKFQIHLTSRGLHVRNLFFKEGTQQDLHLPVLHEWQCPSMGQ